MKTKPSERIAVLILTLLILGGGTFPQSGVASRHHAAKALIEHRATTDSFLLSASSDHDEPVSTEAISQ